MDAEASGRILLAHAGEVPGDPRGENGFLGSLRPFRGLREQDFLEVMSALHGLRDVIRGDTVPRSHVAAIWDLCRRARFTGLAPRSPLQRNKLLSEADSDRLACWVRTIEESATFLLHGKEDWIAFFGMIRLIAERRVSAPVDPWTEVAGKVLEEHVLEDDPSDHLVAIRALTILRDEPARSALRRATGCTNVQVRAAAEDALRSWDR